MYQAPQRGPFCIGTSDRSLPVSWPVSAQIDVHNSRRQALRTLSHMFAREKHKGTEALQDSQRSTFACIRTARHTGAIASPANFIRSRENSQRQRLLIRWKHIGASIPTASSIPDCRCGITQRLPFDRLQSNEPNCEVAAQQMQSFPQDGRKTTVAIPGTGERA
jgi:hypothetical protein